MVDMATQILSLHIYPIKSCAGIELSSSELDRAGLQGDRQWMLVSPDGRFMTQRRWPEMARIQPSMSSSHLIVQAPGMDSLHVPLESDQKDGPVREVIVWKDRVLACEESAEASAWFTKVLGTQCALVRTDRHRQRPADMHWVAQWRENYPDYASVFAGEHGFGFADGFPLLVANQASLDDLNARLVAKGKASVPMNRFRPNIVIQGEWEPYDEDLTIQVSVGDITLAFVKPCTRCPIPNIDQQTGERFDEPGQTLASYRVVEAGVVFGQNAIVNAFPGARLSVGDEVKIDLNF